jgi:hypothetical protein
MLSSALPEDLSLASPQAKAAAALPEAQVYVKYIMFFAVVPKVGIQGLY